MFSFSSTLVSAALLVGSSLAGYPISEISDGQVQAHPTPPASSEFLPPPPPAPTATLTLPGPPPSPPEETPGLSLSLSSPIGIPTVPSIPSVVPSPSPPPEAPTTIPAPIPWPTPLPLPTSAAEGSTTATFVLPTLSTSYGFGNGSVTVKPTAPVLTTPAAPSGTSSVPAPANAAGLNRLAKGCVALAVLGIAFTML